MVVEDNDNSNAQLTAVAHRPMNIPNELETAAEICKRAPNCHVVLMSGSAKAEDIARRAKFQLLKKPFLVDDLLGMIPDKLEGHARNGYWPGCDAGHKEIGL